MYVVVVLAGIAGCSSLGSPLPSASDAAPGAHAWQCVTAPGAELRRDAVERNMLPRVAFSGDTRPAGVAARMHLHQVPALSVAVIRDGVLDWSAAWGQLHAGGAPADCDSLFQAGSLAKPATVLAALRMQQAGLVDLDADIGTYLSSWQLPAAQHTSANPVTLRNLFTHTAGVTPGGYEGYAQGQPLPTDVQTVAGTPPANARKVEVLEAPGTALRYSGGGYTVAEIALQDRLGQPFEQLMHTWLGVPAGMQQADFTQPLPAHVHGHTARGHRGDGSVVPGGWHNHPEQAAAGLWASASDMAALLIEMRKGWLGESSVFTRETIHGLLEHPIEGHAYGFILIGEGDRVFLTHYGGTVGYRAGMTMNLKSGDGAVYLANSDNGAELGLEFLRAVSGSYGWPVFQQTWVQEMAQPQHVLESLTGRYAFEDGPTISVLYQQGDLVVVFPNGDRYAMTPISGPPRAFIHPATAVRARFQGEGTQATIELYGETGRRLAGGE